MSQQRSFDVYDQPRRPKKRRRSFLRIIGGAMLYAVVVIVVSMILACLAWIAANDVLALNKENHEVTVTVSSDDTFDDVVNMAATHIENCISITGNHISSEYNKYVSLYNRILKIKMNDINLKERMYDYQIKEINSDLQGIEARLFRTESLRSNLNKV